MSYLADKSGDDGRGIFPSKKTIALECELSKNTVIKILREFVEEGLLEEVGIHTQWRTTIYNISLSNLVRLPDLAKGGSKLHPRAEAIVEGVQNDTLGVQSVNPIGSATEPKQPDKNLNYARARERLKRALAPHCAGNERDERLMHTYLQFVQGFDGRRILVEMPYDRDRIATDLNRALREAGRLKVVTDPKLMNTEQGETHERERADTEG